MLAQIIVSSLREVSIRARADFSVKVPGLIKSAEDALSLPIRTEGDAAITVRDIARVQRTYKDRTSYARYSGRDALSLEIVKRPGANILMTAEEVRDVAAKHKLRWPASVDYAINSDVSVLIGDQLKQLEGSILIAVVLVMIVCIAALGLRSALLVGISIPSSFMLAFLLLGAFGYTVNMMVMFGMIIAVGILVDGAIVVVEYADRKNGRRFGSPSRLWHGGQAYVLASSGLERNHTCGVCPVSVLGILSSGNTCRICRSR